MESDIANDFRNLFEALQQMGAECEVPDDNDPAYQLQLASGDAPKRTRRAIRCATTWFYFTLHGRFLGYGYAGYDEEEHFVARVERTQRSA